MKIFYFYAYGERTDDLKSRVMQKYGDDVHMMSIDYNRTKNIIEQYAETVRESKRGTTPLLLIGNALGAYFAFHISNITQTPALLFNPTFNFKNGAEYIYYSPEYKDKTIFLSEKDEVIDVKSTIKYLNSINCEDQVSILEGQNHNIRIDIFDKHFSEFREKYEVVSKEKKKENRGEGGWDFDSSIYDKVVSKKRQVITERQRDEDVQTILENIDFGTPTIVPPINREEFVKNYVRTHQTSIRLEPDDNGHQTI